MRADVGSSHLMHKGFKLEGINEAITAQRRRIKEQMHLHSTGCDVPARERMSGTYCCVFLIECVEEQVHLHRTGECVLSGIRMSGAQRLMDLVRLANVSERSFGPHLLKLDADTRGA